jgi:small-conductance mechanosensitive channel
VILCEVYPLLTIWFRHVIIHNVAKMKRLETALEKVHAKPMMKRLRGRNLAHPGCLIGVTAGLTLGIILAGVLAAVFNVALNTILLTWLGLTVGLGAIGWIVGDRLSSRFPALEEESSAQGLSESTETPPAS